MVGLYWGKARPAGRGVLWHPLAYHSLDVAAVAHTLLKRDPLLLQRLHRTSGLSADALVAWVTLFVALHDLGKFSTSFQGLVPELLRQLQGVQSFPPYVDHHDSTGHLVWQERVTPLLPPVLVGQAPLRRRHQWAYWSPWVRAVTGHHGRPPTSPKSSLSLLFRPTTLDDIKQFVAACLSLWKPPQIQLTQRPADVSSALAPSAWLVAGVAVLADWLGSNQHFFPYTAPHLSLEEYWPRACEQAESALQQCGVLPAPPRPRQPIGDLFPYIQAPTPLQAATDTIELADGPQLLVIEEVTGGGKTEAALMLAHRLMAAGQADGVYLALPTMATANAMWARILGVYDGFFTSGVVAQLTHSARDLVPQAPAPIELPGQDLQYTHNEHSAGQHAQAWMSDNRKKALLAQVGVGTIDQALLGVLPSRHAPLRLLGLHRKVLIVDEVHAYDTYMHSTLKALLRFHASLGGSAILLSATLPHDTRHDLIEAFSDGAVPQQTENPEAVPFPLLTHVSASQTREHPIPPKTAGGRRVGVRFLHNTADVLSSLEATTQAGGCACWIRNTVRAAREAYAAAVARMGAERVHLFHARFILGDRLDIERQILDQFGKASTPAQRAGHLVVATQVIEQSLDLDFDHMVSDLAPIELLLQRAGRLHRHVRPNRADEPVLGVLAPAWSDAPAGDWYRRVFPGAARVYANHAQLWLTMRVLREEAALSTGGDIDRSRFLVESVYGAAAGAQYPEGLKQSADDALGVEFTHAALSEANQLRLQDGYASKEHWLPDTLTPTRLGELQKTWEVVVLDTNGNLQPLFDSEPDRSRASRLSQMAIPNRTFAERVPGPLNDLATAAEEQRKLPAWIRLLPVTLLSDGSFQCDGLDASGRPRTLRYSRTDGLILEKT